MREWAVEPVVLLSGVVSSEKRKGVACRNLAGFLEQLSWHKPACSLFPVQKWRCSCPKVAVQ